MEMSAESKDEECEGGVVGQVFEVTNVKEAFEWERRMLEWHESSQEYSHQVKALVEQMATAQAKLREQQNIPPHNPKSELPSQVKEETFALPPDVVDPETALREMSTRLSTMTKQLVMEIAQGSVMPVQHLRNTILKCVASSHELHNLFALSERPWRVGEVFVKALMECNSLAMGFTQLLYNYEDRAFLMKILMRQLERLQNLASVIEEFLKRAHNAPSEVVDMDINKEASIKNRQDMDSEVGSGRLDALAKELGSIVQICVPLLGEEEYGNLQFDERVERRENLLLHLIKCRDIVMTATVS